jgi:hypothetical protein
VQEKCIKSHNFHGELLENNLLGRISNEGLKTERGNNEKSMRFGGNSCSLLAEK